MQTAKQKKEKNSAADQLEQAQKEAGQSLYETGQSAKQSMLDVGKQTPEEKTRMERLTTATTQPAETLTTQAGPISQALAQRILDRTNQPGLDYDTQSADFIKGVSDPLWRNLKSRGIVPAPGALGGGLASQQFLKEAAPSLAELRTNQINSDLARAQEYQTTALNNQNQQATLLEALDSAIRNRDIEATRIAQDYGIAGTQAQGSGNIGSAQTNQEYINNKQLSANNQWGAFGETVGKYLGTVEANKQNQYGGTSGGKEISGYSSVPNSSGGTNSLTGNNNMLMTLAQMLSSAIGGNKKSVSTTSPADLQLASKIKNISMY